MMLSGWGRFPQADCRVAAPRDVDGLRGALAAGGLIARGNGRAYGDSAMNAANTVHMRHFNRMLGFDAATGQLIAEAGVLLGDIIDAFLPRGWFAPVTPGTRFVTIGGMIAADVHGKNHHRHGSFGGFVDWIDVMQADGEVVRASRAENTDLFEWTIGGMGLTGIILRAAFRLVPVESGWIRQTTVPAANLAAAMAAFEAADAATYSVGWIDCLAGGGAAGRSLIMLGEHACRSELSAAQAADPFAIAPRRSLLVPIDAPAFLLNSLTVRAFNALYYRRGLASGREATVGWRGYFYPLDAILGWNRIYGRKGFAQFQCVLPLAAAEAGLGALLAAIRAAGQGSFLAVLKRFGAQQSRFSFPTAGYTLALDFPVSQATLALLDRLDAITVDHGGRFYLAKDSRMTPDTLDRADPRVGAFRAMRADGGRAGQFVSAQSQRLGL